MKDIVRIVHRRIPTQKLVDEILTAVLVKKLSDSGEPFLSGRIGRGTPLWVSKNGVPMSIAEALIYFHDDVPTLPYENE